MAALAAGRRTKSAFPTFLASTNPSDLLAQYSPSGNGYAAPVIDAVSSLSLVKHAESFSVLNGGVLNPDETARTEPTRIPIAGSVDGGLFDQDRFTVTQGRMANPERADEVMVSQLAADTLDLHLGQSVPIAVIASGSPDPGTGPVENIQARVDATIVGIGKLNSEVVQDDVGRFPTYIVATPAFTRPILDCCVAWTWTGIQLEHGSADVAAVEREYVAALPPGDGYQFHVTTQVQDQVQRAIEPEAIALVAFGAIAAVAGLLIAGQAIGRHMRRNRDDLDVLRRARRRPEHDGRRRSRRHHRSNRRRSAPRGRRRDRAVAARTDRPRAPRVSPPRCRLRLDRARGWNRGRDRRPRRAGDRDCV